MKTNQMVKMVFATALALTMTGCASTGTTNPVKRNDESAYKTKLSGQWKNPDKDEYLDFNKDGTVNIYTHDDQTNQYNSQSAQYVVNKDDVTITTQDNQTYTVSDINNDDVEVDGEKWNKVSKTEEVQDNQIKNDNEENTIDSKEDNNNQDESDEEEYDDDYNNEEIEDDTEVLDEDILYDSDLEKQIQGFWVTYDGMFTIINVFDAGVFDFLVIDEDEGVVVAFDDCVYDMDENNITVKTFDDTEFHTSIQNVTSNSLEEVNGQGQGTKYEKVSMDEVEELLSQCDTSGYMSMTEFLSGDSSTSDDDMEFDDSEDEVTETEVSAEIE